MTKGPPFQLEGLDHINLVVSSMDVALPFYLDVIGCTVEEKYPQWGMAALRCGNALIVLTDISDTNGSWAKPPVAGGRNLDHACLSLGRFDHDALRAHLAAHQVGIVEESFHAGARGESMSFYVRDPSGNQLELKGPPEAAPKG